MLYFLVAAIVAVVFIKELFEAASMHRRYG